MAIDDAAAVPVPFQLLADRQRLAVRTSLAAGVGFSSHYGSHGVGEAISLDVFPKGRRMVSTIKSGLREGGKPEDVTAWVRSVTLVTPRDGFLPRPGHRSPQRFRFCAPRRL